MKDTRTDTPPEHVDLMKRMLQPVMPAREALGKQTSETKASEQTGFGTGSRRLL